MNKVSHFNILGELIDVNDKNAIHRGKYIFVGDSYSIGTGSGLEFGWSSLVPKYLNLNVDDYYLAVKGGSGFCGGTPFLDLLKGININDKSTIENVIVFGGFNDHGFQYDDIDLAIKNFCNYVNENFPNAKIMIGEIGWSPFNDIKVGLVNNVLTAYTQCGKYGATYVCGSEYIMHDYKMFNNDWIHPSTDGYLILARYLASGIINGCIDYKVSYNNVSLNAVAPVTKIEHIIINETIENNIVTLCPANNNTMDMTLLNGNIRGNLEVNIGNFTPRFFYPLQAFTPTSMVCGYLTSNGINHPIYGTIRIEGGAIGFKCMNVDSSGEWVNYENVTYLSLTFPSFALASKYC